MQFLNFLTYPIFILFLIESVCHVGNFTLHHEPAVVKLKGALELQNFHGPPNYESIAKGDKIYLPGLWSGIKL